MFVYPALVGVFSGNVITPRKRPCSQNMFVCSEYVCVPRISSCTNNVSVYAESVRIRIKCSCTQNMPEHPCSSPYIILSLITNSSIMNLERLSLVVVLSDVGLLGAVQSYDQQHIGIIWTNEWTTCWSERPLATSRIKHDLAGSEPCLNFKNAILRCWCFGGLLVHKPWD